jgi:hypothetical protein
MAIKNGNVIQAKTGTATFANTTGKDVFTLPAGAMIVGVRCFGTVSNGDGSNTLVLRTRPQGSTTNTDFVSIDAKTALSGVTGLFAITTYVAATSYVRVSTPVTVSAIFSDGGSTSTTGSYTFVVEYL